MTVEPKSFEPREPYRILIVDDSFIMRKLVSEIIESDPDLIVAGQAENGKVALQLVRQLKPDLVLLDIEMPEMSGLETLRRLGLRSTCKVVVLSSLVGESDSLERREALRLGAVATIGKPSGAVSLDIKHARASAIVTVVRRALGLPGHTESPAADIVQPAICAPLGAEIATLIEAVSIGVMAFDRGARLVAGNAAARALLQLPNLTSGDRLHEIFSDFNAGIAEDLWAAANAGAAFRDLDVDYATKGGDWIPMRLALREVGELAVLSLEDRTRERELAALLHKTQSLDVARALSQEGRVGLGGALKRGTILFSDIRGFTALSEALGPVGTVSMLNEYFSFMADVIRDRGGVVDKYIGDAIMALFGIPEPGKADPDAAVNAARDMMRALDVLNQSREGRLGGEIRIGVGLATGEVVAGAIGSPDRMNYTVIGDAANLASRLEALTKPYGASILACGETVAALQKSVPMRQVDVVRVKGQSAPTCVFEIFVRPPPPSMSSWLTAFAEGFEAYRSGRFASAIGAFDEAARLNPRDAMSRLLPARCRRLKETGAWDGVWTDTEK